MSLIQSLMSGKWIEFAVMLSVKVFTCFCVFPVHEYAHAWMATRLGDNTARLSGRLTLNPMAHLSPMGTIMMFLFGFGYAKPVPVNIRNFKNRKRDFALTALAGPVSNLLMALIYGFIANLFIYFDTGTSSILHIAILFMQYAAMINVYLAVFNLIPIPPLDGSRILTAVLPDHIYYKIMQYERFIMIGLIVLLFSRVLYIPLDWLSSYVLKFIMWFTGLIFTVF